MREARNLCFWNSERIFQSQPGVDRAEAGASRHALRGVVRVRAIGGEHLGRAVAAGLVSRRVGRRAAGDGSGEPARASGDAGDAALVGCGGFLDGAPLDAAASWVKPGGAGGELARCVCLV